MTRLIVVLCATVFGCSGNGGSRSSPDAGGNGEAADAFVGDWFSLTGSYKVSQCAIAKLDTLSTSSLQVRVSKSSSTTGNVELVYGKASCILVGEFGSQFIADSGQICNLGYEPLEVQSLFINVQAAAKRGQINILGVGTMQSCLHELTGNLARD